MFGEVMMITWASFGLRIERVNESQDSLEIYISVPETSYQLNVRGNQMAGNVLAKSFKEEMVEMGVKRLIVKSRIRSGEHWTKEMADKAELDMRKQIYGSQY